MGLSSAIGSGLKSGLADKARMGDELLLPREQIFKRKTPSIFVFVFILMMRKLMRES